MENCEKQKYMLGVKVKCYVWFCIIDKTLLYFR